jgi:hypothetical protein
VNRDGRRWYTFRPRDPAAPRARIDDALRALGPDYAAGTAALDDVCKILDVSISDGVALLEQFGYARPREHIALSDAQRDEMFASLRASRLERAGRPHASLPRIVRDVVATQRIEGIDARPWIALLARPSAPSQGDPER